MAFVSASSGETFTISHEIGEGNFAKVLMASSSHSVVPFAVKALRGVKSSLKVVSDEIKLTAKVSAHPCIVSYKDAVYDPKGDAMYLVVEYCNDGTLKDKLNGLAASGGAAKWDQDTVLGYAIQILLAVEFMHLNGILHRDLKSENVFLVSDASLSVRIGDFGLAEQIHEPKSYAALPQEESKATGTFLYMAPEVITGENYSKSADMWSVGCILYEMANGGRSAFGNGYNGYRNLVDNIVKVDIDPLDSAVYDRELSNLVLSMLSIDPRKRPSASVVLASPLFMSAFARIFSRPDQDKLLAITERVDGSPSPLAIARAKSHLSNPPSTPISPSRRYQAGADAGVVEKKERKRKEKRKRKHRADVKVDGHEKRKAGKRKEKGKKRKGKEEEEEAVVVEVEKRRKKVRTKKHRRRRKHPKV